MPLGCLERASVLAVESLLRNSTSTDDGDYTDVETAQFLTSNCPRFENFSTLNGDGSYVGSGKGIDVQMFIVHKEYCESIEARIMTYLVSIDVDPEMFRQACAAVLAEPSSSPAKRAAINLVRFVERYQDFSLFGHMMESEFLRVYAAVDADVDFDVDFEVPVENKHLSTEYYSYTVLGKSRKNSN